VPGTGVTAGDTATNAAAAAAGTAGTQALPNTSNVPQGGAAQASDAQPGGTQMAQAGDEQPVGKPPDSATAPPAIAPIFDQPGVLTPAGKIVVEPSFQYGYSSNNRVALVGYTIIPEI